MSRRIRTRHVAEFVLAVAVGALLMTAAGHLIADQDGAPTPTTDHGTQQHEEPTR